MVDRAKFAATQKPYMTIELYAPNDGETLTIRDVQEVTINARSGKSFKKLQLWWVEDRPPLDLNNSMLSFLIGTYGPDDDAWVRQKVYVFHDPTIPTKHGMGALALDTAKVPTRPTAAKRNGPDPDLRRELNKQQQEAAAQADPDDDVPF